MLMSRWALRRLPLPTTGSTMIAREASTVTGKSGRRYIRGRVLRQHPRHPELNVREASSGNDRFVIKRASRSTFGLHQRVAAEFDGSKRLRLHTECNNKENVLIYPYFKGTLLSLIRDNPGFPIEGRMKILRHVGEAIQELHREDWAHLDVKPDNILVNYDLEKAGDESVTSAILGDFDLIRKCDDHTTVDTPYAVGNVMWRSPEGQTGRGMSKASDIYSFGLVCLYALGAADLIVLHDDFKELAGQGITPEQHILTQHFCYFGPVPEAATKVIGSEDWSAALALAARMSDVMVKENPMLRFEVWGEDLGPEDMRAISGMTALDPKQRLDIDQVMSHPLWDEELG